MHLSLLQRVGGDKPGHRLTVERNFMQVQAGGVLVHKASVLKKSMRELGATPGVYVVFVRPPGARLWEWTPVYLGEATSQDTGERCCSYLDSCAGIFLGDKPPAADKQLPAACKCRLYRYLAARGFDVGIL